MKHLNYAMVIALVVVDFLNSVFGHRSFDLTVPMLILVFMEIHDFRSDLNEASPASDESDDQDGVREVS
jgi:hypothetical protein